MVPLLEKWVWLPTLLVGMFLGCALKPPFAVFGGALFVVGIILFLRRYYRGVPHA